jgi:microcystin-dependent protein
MDNVSSQVSGSSSVLAADWNTFVRDNFDDIKAGHVVVADATARLALGVVTAGTMVFEASTNKLWVYTTGWFELGNFTQNTAVSSGGGPFSPFFSPVGMVTPFGGAAAPTGWLLCDGSTLNSTTTPAYTALFSIIGTSFGGSGAASFNVPNLLGRGVVGAGAAGAQNGTSGSGALTGGTALTARALGSFFGDQFLQAHTHTGSGTSGSASATTSYDYSINQYSAGSGSGFKLKADSQAGGFSGGVVGTAGDHTHPFSFTTSAHNQTQGAGQNSEPNLALTYIIKY